MSAWPIFEVAVDGYTPEIFTARTRSKATWRAYSAFREMRPSTSFADWIARTRIRKLTRLPLDDDGYDNVRAQYGVNPTIGERRVLVNEGPNDGREVVVLYPGRHTCMIHCAYLGHDRPMIVHPLNARAA